MHSPGGWGGMEVGPGIKGHGPPRYKKYWRSLASKRWNWTLLYMMSYLLCVISIEFTSKSSSTELAVFFQKFWNTYGFAELLLNQHTEYCNASRSDAGKWSLWNFIVINQLQIWPRGDMDSIQGVRDANLCRWLSLVYCTFAWNSRVRKRWLLSREQALEIADLCPNCHLRKSIRAQKRLASQFFWQIAGKWKCKGYFITSHQPLGSSFLAFINKNFCPWVPSSKAAWPGGHRHKQQRCTEGGAGRVHLTQP